MANVRFCSVYSWGCSHGVSILTALDISYEQHDFQWADSRDTAVPFSSKLFSMSPQTFFLATFEWQNSQTSHFYCKSQWGHSVFFIRFKLLTSWSNGEKSSKWRGYNDGYVVNLVLYCTHGGRALSCLVPLLCWRCKCIHHLSQGTFVTDFWSKL